MAEDVLLLIEVSDTTLDKDLTVKLPRYAEAEIPEVWVVNVNNGTLCQAHSLDPDTKHYQHEQTYGRGDEVWTTLGISVAVADIVGGGDS